MNPEPAVPRHALVAVDGSENSKVAVIWAAKNLLRTEDNLHLARAISVPAHPSQHAGDSHTAADKKRRAAEDVLREAAEVASRVGVPKECIRATVLPTSAGAPSAGAALVAFVHSEHFKVVVVGSRGMGAIKRAVLDVLGTGSVSDYVVQHAEQAVAVVRQELQLEAALQALVRPQRNICVAVDGSPRASAALEWALNVMADPTRDILHLLTVAVTPPPPGFSEGPASVLLRMHLDERHGGAKAAAAASEAAWEATAAATRHGFPSDHILHAALDPLHEGKGGVSGAIIRYVSDHKVDALVVGGRGSDSFQSGMLSVLGLGSVSSACVQSAPCPVIVARLPQRRKAAASVENSCKAEG